MNKVTIHEEDISAIEASRRISEFAKSLDLDDEIIDKLNSLDSASFIMSTGDIVRISGNNGDGFLKGKQMSKVLGKRKYKN